MCVSDGGLQDSSGLGITDQEDGRCEPDMRACLGGDAVMGRLSHRVRRQGVLGTVSTSKGYLLGLVNLGLLFELA